MERKKRKETKSEKEEKGKKDEVSIKISGYSAAS